MLFYLLESSSCLECCEVTVMGIQHCERVGTDSSEVKLCEPLCWVATGSFISCIALMFPQSLSPRMEHGCIWLETMHSSLLAELLRAVLALNLLQCPPFIRDYWKSKNCFKSPLPSSFPPYVCAPAWQLLVHSLSAGIAHTKRCVPMSFQAFLSSERCMVNSSLVSNFIAFYLPPEESLRGSKMDVCVVCLIKSFTKRGRVSVSP